jgi:hypothetical protein
MTTPSNPGPLTIDEPWSLATRHSRTFVHEGVEWRVWPSVIENITECRPPKVITDLGPPRLFFYSRNGEFYTVPRPDVSWAGLAAIPDSELRAWLLALKRQLEADRPTG